MGRPGQSRLAGLCRLTMAGALALMATTGLAAAQTPPATPGDAGTSAQPGQGQPRTLPQTRYLSWAGRPSAQGTPAPASTGVPVGTERSSPAEPMPVRAAPYTSGTAQITQGGAPAGLTPSPLLARPDLGVIASPRAVAPAASVSASRPEAARASAMSPSPAQPAPAPLSAGQPAPASAAASASTSASAAASAPAPQARVQADHDTARYYSVHRGNGREPDAPVIPEPFFLDHAPVDLAEPPPPPTLRNGRGLAPSIAEQGEP